MTIVVTESARADLQGILSFYRAPGLASDELLSAFERGAHHLRQWPFTGHRRRDLTKADVCFWFEDPSYFVLQVKQDTLFIVAFLHSARKIPPLLRRRLGKKDHP